MPEDIRPRLSCAEVSELLPAHVLDSLEVDAADQLREHLAGCPDCRAEAAELSSAVAAMADQVTPVPPPSDLRRRVLAAVHAERGAPTVPATSHPRGSPSSWLGVAAALLLAVGAGSWGLAEHLAKAAPAQGALPITPVEQLIASGRAQVVPLSPVPGYSGRAALVTAGSRGAYLLLSGVPKLSGERSYTLWFLQPGQPHSSPLAVVEVTGPGAYRLPEGPEGYGAAAVTREPLRSDRSARGPVLLSGKL
jgi:hypothetical protein